MTLLLHLSLHTALHFSLHRSHLLLSLTVSSPTPHAHRVLPGPTLPFSDCWGCSLSFAPGLVIGCDWLPTCPLPASTVKEESWLYASSERNASNQRPGSIQSDERIHNLVWVSGGGQSISVRWVERMTTHRRWVGGGVETMYSRVTAYSDFVLRKRSCSQFGFSILEIWSTGAIQIHA